jgi:SNF2 family DNA or RNA helicase
VQLFDAVLSGRTFVRVGDRAFLKLSEELRKRILDASDAVWVGRAGLELSTASAPALESLFDGLEEASLCAEFEQMRARIARATGLQIRLPRGLSADLRDYQKEGFRWLSRLAEWRMGGVLADDMGLGKTLQALAVLLRRKDEGPALVIAPTSVCFNWIREAERFAPDLVFHELRESVDWEASIAALGAGDVLLASYGITVRNIDALSGRRFATLVLDEAQAIKNAVSQRAQAVRRLEADFRFALTGTPLENHLGELWSLMRIVTPGLLGSWEQFRARFAIPIERHGRTDRRQALSRLLRPYVLRRTKAQVAPELPPRTEVRHDVVLGDAERSLYDAARAAILKRLARPEPAAGSAHAPGSDRRFEVFAALTRLRQLACHPRLVDGRFEGSSAKLDALMHLLRELADEGHRALVFSQFTSHLALVREVLDAEKIEYVYLDGETPARERAVRVDRFQNSEVPFFLISLKAGGTGLNLMAADYVIHLDPWWNPAVEDQATDRAHRIGKTKPVTVIRLVARGTVEDAILALHADKRALVADVLDGTGAAAKLGIDELVGLIRQGATDAGD